MRRLVPGRMELGLLLAGVALAIPSPVAVVTAQTGARQHVVTMSAMRYGRIPTGMKVGDTIVWVNRDSVPHTVTARDKSFDLRLNRGQSARMTLRRAGTIPIYCILHPAMRGTLQVAK